MKNAKSTITLTVCLGLVMACFAATSANAVTYQGIWLTDSSRYSLITEGGTPAPTNDPVDWLRFDPGQSFVFDITGDLLTASGPQAYSLSSDNGATATFTLSNLVLDLSGPNGLASGSMDYDLDGTAGTFTFIEHIYGSSGFNTSSFNGDDISAFIWGGDTVNLRGFDGGFTGSPIPIPGALVLFASAIGALGLRRRITA